MHPTQPRRRPWPAVLLLLATAVALALVGVVLLAPPAGASAPAGAPAQVWRAPGSSPLPWLAGAALPAMAVVAAVRIRTARRPAGPFNHPDLPGGA
jgi:hypothetical protein